MNRREFLRLAGAASAATLLHLAGGPAACTASQLPLPTPSVSLARPASPTSTARPNLILILADDLGYAGLGCQGGDLPTPNIDSLTAGGVRAASGYVTCPVCAPTRAGLLTGRYQQRFGFETNPGPGDETSGLPLSEKIIPEYLKELGYATAMFGKWHLGSSPEQQPTQRGFDEFFGFLGGSHSYLPGERQTGGPLLRGDTPVQEAAYLTDALRGEALSFIDRRQHEPFFLYLAFNAVHTPLQAPDEYMQRFTHIADEARRTHAAMLAALDDAVGAVLNKLAETGLEQDTLVVFLSDNGGPTAQTTASNAPLRGGKATLYEGGVRVPFLLRWPRRLPAGLVYTQPIASLDLLPTLLSAAGAASSAQLDGVDLLPHLSGSQPAAPHDQLYWRMRQQWALRSGDWKLVQTEGGRRPMLFNLAEDLSEQNDLSTQEPARLRTLRSQYQAWADQMVDSQAKSRKS
ncbi:MAG: sulfatase-like hydrolase/transferase [Chloroflexota bacterium]